MDRPDLASIAARLRGHTSFLIATHTNPDGDAIGSMLGMMHLLRALGKTNIACINDDPVPRVYAWLPGASEIRPSHVPLAGFTPDAVILVDAGKKDRAGHAAECFPAGVPLYVLDHHLEERPDGDFRCINPSYSATGELICELFQAAGLPVHKPAAECLYTAIATDTGGFRFSNTTPRTHRIAAMLLEAGVDAAVISSRVFDSISKGKIELIRRALDRMQMEADGRIAHTFITARDMDEARAKVEDLDNIINFARNIEGVEVGILFRETAPDTTKVSMRSSDSFNSASFLAPYGGGGHKAAAGGTLKGTLDAIRAEIVNKTIASLGETK